MLAQGKWVGGLVLLWFIIMAACGLLSTVLFAKVKEVKEAAGKRRLQQKDS